MAHHNTHCTTGECKYWFKAYIHTYQLKCFIMYFVFKYPITWTKLLDSTKRLFERHNIHISWKYFVLPFFHYAASNESTHLLACLTFSSGHLHKQNVNNIPSTMSSFLFAQYTYILKVPPFPITIVLPHLFLTSLPPFWAWPSHVAAYRSKMEITYQPSSWSCFHFDSFVVDLQIQTRVLAST